VVVKVVSYGFLIVISCVLMSCRGCSRGGNDSTTTEVPQINDSPVETTEHNAPSAAPVSVAASSSHLDIMSGFYPKVIRDSYNTSGMLKGEASNACFLNTSFGQSNIDGVAVSELPTKILQELNRRRTAFGLPAFESKFDTYVKELMSTYVIPAYRNRKGITNDAVSVLRGFNAQPLNMSVNMNDVNNYIIANYPNQNHRGSRIILHLFYGPFYKKDANCRASCVSAYKNILGTSYSARWDSFLAHTCSEWPSSMLPLFSKDVAFVDHATAPFGVELDFVPASYYEWGASSSDDPLAAVNIPFSDGQRSLFDLFISYYGSDSSLWSKMAKMNKQNLEMIINSNSSHDVGKTLHFKDVGIAVSQLDPDNPQVWAILVVKRLQQ